MTRLASTSGSWDQSSSKNSKVGSTRLPSTRLDHDNNHVDDEHTWADDDEEEDEEAFMSLMLEAGDEDANFVNDFEDQILMACQESMELASCFTTYQKARNRLREKARSHGFWPLGNSKGRGRH